MSPITDAIRIFTHPTFHDITLKIKGGLSYGMKEDSCLSLAPTARGPEEGSSIESQKLVKGAFL